MKKVKQQAIFKAIWVISVLFVVLGMLAFLLAPLL